MNRFLRLFVVFLALVVGLTGCDLKRKQRKIDPAKKKQAAESFDARLKAAREKMLTGDSAGAVTAFAELSADPDLQPSKFNWVIFQHGLALLFDGKESEARAVFAKIKELGPSTKDEQQIQLSDFFMKISKLLSAANPIPPDTVKDYDRWTYESIGLLAVGLKNWGLEKYEEAVPFFREFTAANPEKAVEWADGSEDLGKLKQSADDFANDYLAYKPASDALKAATTTSTQYDAVELAKAAREKMKRDTKLRREIDSAIADLGPKVASIMAEKAKASAEDLAFDDKALPEARQKRKDLMAKFLFADAKAAIADLPLRTEKARDERELLMKRSSWLFNFKAQLIDDINAGGYNQPITTKKGATSPGGVAKADEQQLLLPSPRGLVPMPWADLSPDSAFAMGKFFIKSDMPPEIMGFRKWHLGVFASYVGKQTEALALLKEAADLRPILREELPQFETPPTDW